MSILCNKKEPIAKGQKTYVRGTISLCYCKGHDCILAVFPFDGFYETDRRLFLENCGFSD